MGTFVSIEYLNLENNFDLSILNNITNKAFQLIQNLAKKIRSLNNNTNKLKKEFCELLDFCEYLQSKSENAFIYKINDVYDLDGVAKGYIIDKSLEYIIKKLQNLNIKKGIVLINAGGDISYKSLTDKKYFDNLFKFIFEKIKLKKNKNINDIKVLVRLGEAKKSLFREIKLIKNSIASSTINVSLSDKKSTTNYYNRKPKRKLNNNSTVVVQASNAMIADALTKVLLFASVKIVKKILKTQNANAWVFDKNGKIIEKYN